MKITFLGTSHGLPERNRRCSCSLIEVSGRYYFVDMGCMAMDDLVSMGISSDAVKAIFFTHLHGDHVNGLVEYADLLSWAYLSPKPAIFLSDTDLVKPLEDFITVCEGSCRHLDYRKLRVGEIYDDGTIKVTAHRTEHYDSYAFEIEAEGKTVVFSGDLKNPNIDFPQVKNPDLIVAECAHFPAVEYIEPFRKLGIGNAVINHYAPGHLGSMDELKKALEGECNITYATDYMSMTL